MIIYNHFNKFSSTLIIILMSLGMAGSAYSLDQRISNAREQPKMPETAVDRFVQMVSRGEDLISSQNTLLQIQNDRTSKHKNKFEFNNDGYLKKATFIDGKELFIEYNYDTQSISVQSITLNSGGVSVILYIIPNIPNIPNIDGYAIDGNSFKRITVPTVKRITVPPIKVIGMKKDGDKKLWSDVQVTMPLTPDQFEMVLLGLKDNKDGKNAINFNLIRNELANLEKSQKIALELYSLERKQFYDTIYQEIQRILRTKDKKTPQNLGLPDAELEEAANRKRLRTDETLASDKEDESRGREKVGNFIINIRGGFTDAQQTNFGQHVAPYLYKYMKTMENNSFLFKKKIDAILLNKKTTLKNDGNQMEVLIVLPSK